MNAHVQAAAEFHGKARHSASVSKIVERDWRSIRFISRVARRADQSVSKWLEARGFTVVFHLHAAQKVVDTLGDDVGLGSAVESVNERYCCRVTGDVRLNAEIAVDVVVIEVSKQL